MSSEPAPQGAQKSSNESILAFWSGLAVPSFYSVPSTVLQSWCSPWSPEGEKGLRGLSAFPQVAPWTVSQPGWLPVSCAGSSVAECAFCSASGFPPPSTAGRLLTRALQGQCGFILGSVPSNCLSLCFLASFFGYEVEINGYCQEHQQKCPSSSRSLKKAIKSGRVCDSHCSLSQCKLFIIR